MTFSFDVFKSQYPFNIISFEELKEVYPSLENGDYVLEEKKTVGNHIDNHKCEYIDFYMPNEEKYFNFHIRVSPSDCIFSNQINKKRLFSIIKSDDKKMFEILKYRLSNLIEQAQASRRNMIFSVAANNASYWSRKAWAQIDMEIMSRKKDNDLANSKTLKNV